MRRLAPVSLRVMVAALGIACGSDSTEPTPPNLQATPASLAIISSSTITLESGRTLAPAPVVELRDESNKPVTKAGVTIAARIEDATLSGTTSTTTGPDGRVTFDALTVSGPPGVHTLTFSSSGVTAAVAAVTLHPAPVAGMAALSPLLQNGAVGTPAPVPPSVRLVDAGQRPVEGGTVRFVVQTGSGQPSETSIITGADGVATLPSWTLGTTPGLNEVIAVTGTDTIYFRAGAGSAAAGSLIAGSPVAQTVMLGQELATQPRVRVWSAGGQAVAGAVVVFSGSSPSGPIDDSISVSDADGFATARHWKPSVPGSHALKAGLPSVALAPVRFDVTVIRQGAIAGLAADNQVALANAPVPQPPAVLVTSDGAPLAGVTVAFAVTGGDGSLGATTAMSGDDGIARLPSWTLGATPGRNEVTAVAPGFDPAAATFHAFGVAALPASLSIAAGDSQTAPVLSPLPVYPVVRVADANGAPVAGYPVAFAVSGGSIGSSVAETDASGLASAGPWSMPSTCPAQLTLTASAPLLAGSPQTIHASCTVGPPRLIVKGPDSTRAVVGNPAPTPPSLHVFDAGGNGVPDVPVSFAVTTGNGSITAASLTGPGGRWTATSWILGTTAGANEVTVTVGSLPSVTFHAIGTGGPATTMDIASGDMASAPVYSALTAAVHLTDQYGNDSPGQWVTFTTTGDARVVPGSGTAISDSLGLARVAWRMGGGPGAYALTATGPNGLLRVLSATATDVTSPFDMDVHYIGSPTPALEAAVAAAVARWRAIITADLPDVLVHADSAACFPAAPPIDTTVDDVQLFIEIADRDGAGGILGAAGPCLIRSTGGLPALGYVTLDAADVDLLTSTGELADVVLHEIGHVLGIGTLWSQDGLVINSGTTDPRYGGAQAFAGYQAIGGRAPTVPLESSGGDGTAESHWRESTFGWEVMTGYIATADNPLSRMTIGSLADLGYAVNYDRADYMRMTESVRADLRLAPRRLREFRLPSPIVIVDREGRVVGRRTRLH